MHNPCSVMFSESARMFYSSFAFFLIVCLIRMCGCCVRGLLSDAVWLLLFGGSSRCGDDCN